MLLSFPYLLKQRKMDGQAAVFMHSVVETDGTSLVHHNTKGPIFKCNGKKRKPNGGLVFAGLYSTFGKHPEQRVYSNLEGASTSIKNYSIVGALHRDEKGFKGIGVSAPSMRIQTSGTIEMEITKKEEHDFFPGSAVYARFPDPDDPDEPCCFQLTPDPGVTIESMLLYAFNNSSQFIPTVRDNNRIGSLKTALQHPKQDKNRNFLYYCYHSGWIDINGTGFKFVNGKFEKIKTFLVEEGLSHQRVGTCLSKPHKSYGHQKTCSILVNLSP